MFIKKNKYYIYIENLSSINLNLIKTKGKFNLIYRSKSKNEKLRDIVNFAKICKKKCIKFFIANNISLASKVGANGIYLSSYNKALVIKNKRNGRKFEIIGSVHNLRDITIKNIQGCNELIFSRLFKTDYKNKKSFLGTTKFNLFTKNYKSKFIALGGIRSKNLMKLKIVRCEGFALLSEPKKKPAIIRRLF